MADKREARKDLPKREFDADLNSSALSNYDDPPVDQRDSDGLRDHIGNARTDDEAGAKSGNTSAKKHDAGNADNLSR